jgi:serine/threonine protein kinase
VTGRATPDAWQDMRAIFEAALLRDPEERAAFLDTACAAKPELRSQVAALLAVWNEDTGRFERTPSVSVSGAAVATSNSAAAGRMIGPYLVRDELGRGGMGVVYLADDTILGRRVALKALHRELAASAEQRERLRQEARIAAGLSHSGIATVYALEEIDGTLYVASEFVPGRTVRSLIQDGPLPPPLLVNIATQVTDVLVAAHAQGVVHRDLKPENVMLTPAGLVKVLDFGLARSENAEQLRLTQSGSVVGTPAYMAPEQLRGERVDSRADVFALGALMYEMASGISPFEASTLGATVEKVLRDQPQALSTICSVPAAMERVVEKCLKKRAGERYYPTDTLLRELQAVRESLASGDPPSRGARTPAASGSTRTRTSRSRWWWEFHQIAISVLNAGMVYPTWYVRGWLPQPWGMLALFAVIGSGAAATILRLNLRFTARIYPTELAAQSARSRPWIRVCEAVFAGSLIAAGAGIAPAHPAFGALFVTAAIGSVLAATIIEPTTTRAAFRRRASSVRIPPQRPSGKA